MTAEKDLSKHGGPNDWQEARRGLVRRKAKINQRNQQIRDLKFRVAERDQRIKELSDQLATNKFEDVLALEKDLAIAVEALKKNGRHVETCMAWCGTNLHQRWSKLDESKCNCGLTAALSRLTPSDPSKGKP